jgi:lysophospholipase
METVTSGPLAAGMAPFVFRFITAKDGTRLRTGVFEPEKKSRRVCVLLSGQTEFIEKYFEVIAELNARGLVVAAFDWRGQGGSARALSNPLKAHVGDFAEYDDDLASFMDQVVMPISTAKPLVLGHSLGGHMALRAMHDTPGLFRGAVLTAPMLAVSTRGWPRFLPPIVAALQNAFGKRNAFAWGMEEHDPLTIDFDAQLCTSDVKRYARTQDILLAHPELRLAGPTWGWIGAAYRAMRKQRRRGYAEAIDTPVLIVGAGRDRIVLKEAGAKFAARLPKGKHIALEDSEHEILMEQDSIRTRFWQAFDAFVDAL